MSNSLEYDREIHIVEVGPRDGLQNEKKLLPVEKKVEFISGLLKANLPCIEVTSFVKPNSIPQLADAEEMLKLLKTSQIFNAQKYLALVPNLKGLERAVKSGISRVAFFTATSETFNNKNINASIEESLLRMQEMVSWIDEKGLKLRIRGYISTVFGCPYEGKIAIQKIVDVTKSLLQLGVEEISFGDTIGVATPLQVRAIIGELKNYLPLQKIAMHFHDTRGMALTNIYESLNQGVRRFDSSAAGLGGCPYAHGASGNVATEDLVYLFESMGLSTGVDLDQLIQTSRQVLNELGHKTTSKFLTTQI